MVQRFRSLPKIETEILLRGTIFFGDLDGGKVKAFTTNLLRILSLYWAIQYCRIILIKDGKAGRL